MNAVESLTRARGVYVEGPPIYAWPDTNRVAQNWNSLEFRGGWQHLEDLVRFLGKQAKVSHWLMVDDVNNRPPLSLVDSIPATLGKIQQAMGGEPISLFKKLDHAYLESEFVKDPSKALCATLDASFQMNKLLHMEEDTRLVICHPEAFKNQQRMMLEHVLAEMKSRPPYQQMPKNDRRQFIADTFIHLWVGSQGNISEITHPVWAQNTFRFEPLDK